MSNQHHNYEMSYQPQEGAPMQTRSDGYDDDVPRPPQHHSYGRSPPRRPVAPYARQPGPPTSGYYAPQSHQPAYSESGRQAAMMSAGHSPINRSPERNFEPAPVDTGYYGHQEPYHHPSYQSHHSDSPFADHHRMNSQESVPRDRGDISTHQVGYGYGQDQLMPGGRVPYRGDGYDEYMDPANIADDGEDDIGVQHHRRSKSRLPLVGGAAAGAAAAGGAGVMNAFGNRDTSGSYRPVHETSKAEKSEWLREQNHRKKKLRWIVGVIVIVVLAAIGGGVAAALLSKSSSSSGRGSASDANGIWDSDSSQVQAVLGNKNLHKVFPGMDYTPLNAQYPACLSNMPYQNDVTLDVAVLSQLTPAIRLYGTDCKQTEMVLKAIDLLGYNSTLKVWIGVWLENNSTTNTRQLQQMYNILDTYPSDHFAGVIIGNEVLFREDMTITELASQLTTVRRQLASRGIDLPVATSDLGDDWTAALAADSDIVMSNVHPFFAGVTPNAAPGWTWNFWQTHDAVLKTSSSGPWPANIISETGWPSEGGNDCGNGAKCPTKTAGAVAGIDELNEFMDGWVCPSLANGTTYFWFEAFDEPWKEIFNDAKTGDFWEPHWGLMDVDRNLKKGVVIPDCGGRTVEKAY